MTSNGKLLTQIMNKLDKPKRVTTPKNQWQTPGELTKINSRNITMQGVGFDAIGMSPDGTIQYMEDGQDYYFPSAPVTEFPLMQVGGGVLLNDKTVPMYFQKGGSFGAAFAAARNKKQKVFEWNGKTYTTEMKGETTAPVPKTNPMPGNPSTKKPAPVPTPGRPVAARPAASKPAAPKGPVMKRVMVDNRNPLFKFLGINEDEVKGFDVPEDVYNMYQQQIAANKGKKFGIVSKQNARAYFFDEYGNLAVQDEVGLGSDRGEEQPVFYKVKTTPSGTYRMSRPKFSAPAADRMTSGYDSKNFFFMDNEDPNKRLVDAPGSTRPVKPRQAMHGIPKHLKGQREPLFNNNNVRDNYMSAGCINCRREFLDNPYFDQFSEGYVYVTPEQAAAARQQMGGYVGYDGKYHRSTTPTWSGNTGYQIGGGVPSIEEMDKFDENAYKQMMQAAITSAQGQMQQNTDNLSFGKAFALHRSLGDKTFEWKGKKYTTKLATETKPRKPQTARQPAVDPKYNLTTPDEKDRYYKYKTKDGYTARRFPDGQVEVFLPDRTDVYYPDGTIAKKYNNNRTVIINKDGTKQIGNENDANSYVPLKSPTKSSRSNTQVKSPTAAVKKQNSQRVNGPLTAITEGIDWLNDHTGDNPLGAATRFVLNTVKAPFEGGKNLAANTQTLANEGRNEFSAHSVLDAANAFAPALGKGMAFVSESIFPFLSQAPGVVFSGGTSTANRAVLSATPKAAGAVFPASSRNMLDETLTAFSKMASSDSKHAARFADARNSLWNSRIPFQAGGPIVGQELEVTPEQVEILRAQGYEFEII